MARDLMKILITVLFFTGLIFSYDSGSRIFDESAVKGSPVFRYSIFRSFSENGSDYTLNIHSDIPNERLQFVKMDSVFRAGYVFSAAVFKENDTEGIPQFQRSVNENIHTDEYKETQSQYPEQDHSFKFTMRPGRYTVVLFLKDTNSEKKHTVKKVIDFPEFSELMISDMTMVTWKDDDDFLNTHKQLINNIVDKTSDFTGALFEIYSDKGIPLPFSLKYRIINSRSSTVYEDDFKGTAEEMIQYQVLKIPLKNLNAGNYKIETEIDIDGEKISRSTVFYLRWRDLSLNVLDMPAAIEQMLYLVEYDSLDKVFGYSEEKKKKWFKDYWNSLENSLELKNNSLMEEYFRRVAYANRNFSVPKKPGWKTDRGKVLCLMGDPDEIQSFPFAKAKRPYEVWIYYDLGTQYIFDYTGGEYRLRK